MRSILYFLFGISIAFFSLSSFAGDRYGYGGVSNPKSAMDQCSQSTTFPADWWAGPCTPSGNLCPSNQNGSGCSETVTRLYRPYGNTQGVTASFGFNATYSYCSDALPTWDGSACVKSNPCKSYEGKYHNGGDVMSIRMIGGDAGSDLNYYSGTGENIPGILCVSGCVANANETKDFGVMAGNQWSIAANPKFTGQSCESAGISEGNNSRVQKNTPQYDCLKSGKSFGTVNGAVVCVDSAVKEGTASNKTTTPNSDGTKTVVEKSTSLNCTGAGSCVTTTTTTTTIVNSSGQTVGTPTTTVTSSESSPGSGSSPAKSSSFCAENPTSPLCKTGSFSGSCDAQPGCEGDPVQCAVAIASWKTDCKTLDPGIPTDDQAPIQEKKLENSFSYTDIGGGSASCPSPQNIVVAGRSIAIEYTPLCQFASGIRSIVILLAWIAAAYIVFARPKNA